MIQMIFKKILKLSEFLRDFRLSRIYLLLVLLAVNIFLIVSSLNYTNNLIASYFVSICIVVFLFTNTKKKLNAKQLDLGVMVHPFDGMSVMLLLEGPDRIVQKSFTTEGVQVSQVTWLYFCIFAITNSKVEKYHYHQHLVHAVQQHCPELMSWIPEIYKTLKSTPPLPDDISVEDFQ